MGQLGQKGRRLGRDTGARTALFRGLLASLIVHERISTTEHKAKETKKVADRMIDLALQNDLAARRQIAKLIPDRDRKSTRLNSSHPSKSRMPSSA